MKNNTLTAIIALGIILAGCKKTIETPQKLDFSCIKLSDELGVSLGTHGCANSNDGNHTTLTATEAAYFSGNDTSFLQGTVSVPITEIPQYPNPVMEGADFRLILRSPAPGNLIKLQLAIIDESKNTLFQYVGNLESNVSLAIEVPSDKFVKGSYYRVYYRVSALGAPIIFEGYNNFLVCKQIIPLNIETDCL